jgi:hypothetical protein
MGKIVKSKVGSSVKERMIVIETLLTNHLHHHELYMCYVLLPCLAAGLISAGGVIFMAVKLILAKVI